MTHICRVKRKSVRVGVHILYNDGYGNGVKVTTFILDKEVV